MKRGFTIVEVIVVIAILGILLGIVSTAVVGSVKNGRKRRAEATCSMLEQALATYYQQKGSWPGAIESKTEGMVNETKHVFSATETDSIIRELVKDSVGRTATRYVIDASALFVTTAGKLKNGGNGCFDNHSDRSCKSYCGNQRCIGGLDFMTASNPKSKDHIGIDNMAFGYAGTKHGKFCRFWITYNGQTDTVKVTRKHPDLDRAGEYPPDWE